MKGALIGCGYFAQNHLHAWRDIAGVEIVALCDQDRLRLSGSATNFGITRTYTDANQLFAEGGFDFVDIATTVHSHHKLVEMAVAAGVHIICQKPFAESIGSARTMVSKAEAAGKTLMVHENFRWQSPVRSALQQVQANAIGAPFFARFSFRSNYDVFSGQPYLAEGERFIIEDLGIHILDIARAFLGDVNTITATTRRINPDIKGEDVATMLLQHESGATSIVDASYATKRSPDLFPQTLIEIDGTAGSLKLEADYKLSVQNHENLVNDVSPTLLAWAEKPWHNIQESVYTLQQHFVECAANNLTPETSGADNLKTLALVEAAYLSAAQGRTVKLSEV